MKEEEICLDCAVVCLNCSVTGPPDVDYDYIIYDSKVDDSSYGAFTIVVPVIFGVICLGEILNITLCINCK